VNGPPATTHADVAILGAGPVGQLLAVLLGNAGWRVEVLERRPCPFDIPRAVHLDHEVARILQAVGLMGELLPFTEAMDAYEWRNRRGDVLLAVQGGRGWSGWPESLMFCQADLERILARRLGEMPNSNVNWQWDVNGLEEHPEGCEVRGSRPDGSPVSLLAQWVVACDGASSTARGLLGVLVEDLGYSFEWVVADVIAGSNRTWRPLNVQICDPARPTTAVSGGPGRRRFEFLCLPGERVEDMSRPEVIWELLRRWDLTPINATLERHAGYRFRSRIASRWQAGPAGRVLLAGDAAHQMPPFAGQGLCAGLRDAANLAWKLDLVLSGAAPPDLMTTYGSERGPVARSEIELSVALGRIACVLDAAEAAERDAAMVPAAKATGPMSVPPPPALGPGVTNPGDGHAGELGLQAVIAQGGRSGLFDDVVGSRGWMLLGALGDPAAALPPALAEWYRKIGGSGLHVAPGAPLDDTEGSYLRWFTDLGASVVLQRPDFRLFGTASDIAGTTELVRAARQALLARRMPAPD
jgi:2-polyprenyl-6-methoxyphenol hydroxylase-like FAD-dependent oxidoreductase